MASSRSSRIASPADTCNVPSPPALPLDELQMGQGESISKWVILKRLGEGSFGVVYEVKDSTGLSCAMKVESVKSEVSILKAEYYVLTEMMKAKAKHFCEIYDSGLVNQVKYLCMSLIGSSLSDLRRHDPTMKVQKFSLGCALSVGIQCVEAIKELHEVGFLHRDIKPDNFAIGRANIRHIYLIDFGLSRKYKERDGRMRPPRQAANFRGTIRYAALRSHYHVEQCRGDDLESWFYQQIELTRGWLPWRYMEDRDEVQDCKEKCREQSRLKEFMGGCPREFIEIFPTITSIGFFDAPDYAKIETLLRNAMRSCDVTDFPYDWEEWIK